MPKLYLCKLCYRIYIRIFWFMRFIAIFFHLRYCKILIFVPWNFFPSPWKSDFETLDPDITRHDSRICVRRNAAHVGSSIHMRMQKLAHKRAYSRSDSLESVIRLLYVVIVIGEEVPEHFRFRLVSAILLSAPIMSAERAALRRSLINYLWNLLIGKRC